jgi:CRISPR-associated endoribonuclease Cas6
MRLLIKLRATENAPYEMEYHHHIQGLIYNTLRGSEYDNHDKKGYKYFCFSNIFPFDHLQKNDLRNLIVSSPNNNFISYLQEQLEYDSNNIRIGRMKFKIDSSDKLNVTLPNGSMFSLITGTPIITRIKKEKYVGMAEQQLTNGHEYIYWRMDHPVDLFITKLEDNLIKKYNAYYGLGDTNTAQRNPIFYKSRFKKQISTRLSMGERDSQQAIVIGTTWEFLFDSATPLVQFGLDTGLGELGSMGFGFMNLKRRE